MTELYQLVLSKAFNLYTCKLCKLPLSYITLLGLLVGNDSLVYKVSVRSKPVKLFSSLACEMGV